MIDELEAIYVPARASSSDPMAQRSYVGVKNIGLIVPIYDGDDPEEAIDKAIENMAARVRQALIEALP